MFLFDFCPAVATWQPTNERLVPPDASEIAEGGSSGTMKFARLLVVAAAVFARSSNVAALPPAGSTSADVAADEELAESLPDVADADVTPDDHAPIVSYHEVIVTKTLDPRAMSGEAGNYNLRGRRLAEGAADKARSAAVNDDSESDSDSNDSNQALSTSDESDDGSRESENSIDSDASGLVKIASTSGSDTGDQQGSSSEDQARDDDDEGEDEEGTDIGTIDDVDADAVTADADADAVDSQGHLQPIRHHECFDGEGNETGATSFVEEANLSSSGDSEKEEEEEEAAEIAAKIVEEEHSEGKQHGKGKHHHHHHHKHPMTTG